MSDPEKEKHTYKISAKELADIEQASAENGAGRKLNRHWANLTFYFMASLSIVLPSLFLLLAVFIGLMKNKLVSSNWQKMEDGITVAISAWPIVFAAVVAQCFKAYATFKVERGIKLMELEQLVGSSSFASAIKQPVLLRRLDLLTLALFGVWCLSPLGSQALLRVYSMSRLEVDDATTEVLLIPNYGPNRLFTPAANGTTLFEDSQIGSDLIQLASTYYIAALTPESDLQKQVLNDRFLHPYMFSNDSDLGFNRSLQAYGAFLLYPPTVLEGLNESDATSDRKASQKDAKAEAVTPRFEGYSFDMPYSYFNLTCGSWHKKTRGELDNTTSTSVIDNSTQPFYQWSESETLGLALTPDDHSNSSSTDHNGISFVSADGATSIKTAADGDQTYPWNDSTWPYSSIDCTFKQIFQNVSVYCETDLGTGAPDCDWTWSIELPEDEVKRRKMETKFGDFISLWLTAGNPGSPQDSPATISELFLSSGKPVSGDSYKSIGLVMSQVPPDNFSGRLGYLFNTYLGIGYCPECVELVNMADAEARPDVKDLYQPIEAYLYYADDLVYVINRGWLAGFIICAAILFLAGLAGVIVESMTVAPDVLGYVSTVARNSRYLQLPKTSTTMSGGERAKTVGSVKVMMQDVKGKAGVGKIALGMKHEGAQRLVPGRLYR